MNNILKSMHIHQNIFLYKGIYFRHTPSGSFSAWWRGVGIFAVAQLAQLPDKHVQWSKLEPLLKELRGDRHAEGRPRKYPLRRVVDALLYVVKTGCQWRQLSADLPPWLSVHQQFRACRDSGFWERITKTLREQGRQAKGRNASPDFLLIVESCPY